MNGLSADMDQLLEVAERQGTPSNPIRVIGDAARACGGEYKGTKIGKKGWMTVFSFHSMKLMTTLGEGGMITTDDPEVAQRVRRLRQFGLSESWGTNFKMNKVQAAVGAVQLRRLDSMIALRRKRAQQRNELLQNVPELTLPYEPPKYKHTYYLYNLLVPHTWRGSLEYVFPTQGSEPGGKRDQIIKILKEEYNVGCAIANPPTYAYHRFIREMTKGQRLPLSEEIGTRLFCPSLHPLMSREQNQYVAAAIIEAVEGIKNNQ
jgi:dTDP-4-amino-4,6-dideoxygalactose transaminase